MASKNLLLLPALATAALGNVLDLDIKVRNGYVCEVELPQICFLTRGNRGPSRLTSEPQEARLI